MFTMNTKQKGSLAVAQCITRLYECGYEVLLPVGDRMHYDLAFDDGKKIRTVQVKYAGMNVKGKCVAGLRITGGNQSYNYAKKYTDKAFDYIYVYTAKKDHFLIKWNDIKVRNELKIEAKKYLKYKI
jgi:hypothetical protein